MLYKLNVKLSNFALYTAHFSLLGNDIAVLICTLLSIFD